jgi:glycosidase
MHNIFRLIFSYLAIFFIFFLLTGCSSPGDKKDKDLSPYIIKEGNVQSKVIIYQVFTRLFGNIKSANIPFGTISENGVGKFNDFTDTALDSIKALGITHVWFTGVIEHALLTDYRKSGIPLDDADVVKGRAGSPYAIKDYYDVNPDLSVNVPKRMIEFENLIERTHRHELKLLIDFVPNHVARNYHSDHKPGGIKDLGENDNASVSFNPENNFYYLPGESFRVPEGYSSLGSAAFYNKDGKFSETPAKVTGNNCFRAQPGINDWFETVKLNYGIDIQNGDKKHFEPVPSTWNKMKDILIFWAGKGIDGFRCDMAEMVPVEFWAWVIPQVKKSHPDILFIAEIYDPTAYDEYISKGGFDFLYDKVQLYDTLRHIVQGKGSANNISKVCSDLRGISSHMVRFLENHDEQRIASSFFAGDPFKALPAMTVTATLYKGPVMIYFGQEVGEPGKGAAGFAGDNGRTTIYDYWGVPMHQKWMNGGRFDGFLLSDSLKRLRNYYKTLLNLSRSEDAFINGGFFDLSLWNRNQDNSTFPGKDIYCFLRFTQKQSLLVIANFNGSTGFNLGIDIPFTISGINILHSSEIDRLYDKLGKTRFMVISTFKDNIRGIVNIQPGESLIFEL